MAKHSGAFARNGLDVVFVPLAGGSAILQALSAGSIDVGFSNLASVQFFEKNAGKLQALAGGTLMDSSHSEAGLVVKADSGIKALRDLRGKTIAVNTRRNIVDLAVLRALKKERITASDIKLVELPFKDMETALRSGKIDAATLPEPILSKAIDAGGLTNLGDHYVLAFGEMYSTGYFAMPSRVAADKTRFSQFNTAIREVTPLVNAFGPDVLKAIAETTKVAESNLKSSGRPKFVEELPCVAMEQMKLWMQEEGFLEQ